MDNNLLDIITMITAGFTVLFFIENFLLLVTSWEVTTMWLASMIRKKPIFIRWGTDRWHFHLADVDPANPKKWSLKLGGKEIPFELKKGSARPGPGKVMMSLIADENSGAATINVDEMLSGYSIGATPAHVAALENTAYAEGYTEGFTKSNPKGTLEWIGQNLGTVIVLGFIIIIGGLLLYDKIWSAPAAWTSVQTCEQEKGIILSKLAQCGGDLTGLFKTTTTTIPAPAISNVGMIVK